MYSLSEYILTNRLNTTKQHWSCKNTIQFLILWQTYSAIRHKSFHREAGLGVGGASNATNTYACLSTVSNIRHLGSRGPQLQLGSSCHMPRLWPISWAMVPAKARGLSWWSWNQTRVCVEKAVLFSDTGEVKVTAACSSGRRISCNNYNFFICLNVSSWINCSFNDQVAIIAND